MPSEAEDAEAPRRKGAETAAEPAEKEEDREGDASAADSGGEDNEGGGTFECTESQPKCSRRRARAAGDSRRKATSWSMTSSVASLSCCVCGCCCPLMSTVGRLKERRGVRCQMQSTNRGQDQK